MSMVVRPSRVIRRLRRLFVQPSDVWFSLTLAHFIWRAPAALENTPLPAWLGDALRRRRPPAGDLGAAIERIDRLSRPWFKHTPFRSRNTCYLRAMMYFRFVDPGGDPLRIHLVIEPRHTAADRLRGHAWVSVGAIDIEPPPREVVSRARRIYTFPDSRVEP